MGTLGGIKNIAFLSWKLVKSGKLVRTWKLARLFMTSQTCHDQKN